MQHPNTVAEVEILIFQDSYVAYHGTHAQLVNEGLIPEGKALPNKDEQIAWRQGAYEFALRRVRPEGHKGPKRSWHALDFWCLEVYSTAHPSSEVRHRKLLRLAFEVQAKLMQAGQPDRLLALYRQAMDDTAYQAFRRRIPGLMPAPRGAAQCRLQLQGGAA